MAARRPSSRSHKKWAEKVGPVRVAVVTVSDSRTPETDTNAEYLRGQLSSSGNHLCEYRLIADEPHLVESVLSELAGSDAQVILFNGGTGISSRDTTFDVLSRSIERPLVGFGELFRMLSWRQVGSAAMLSRATGGVYRGKIIFSVPGSPAAVQLAWEKLISPELQHLVWELNR